MTKLSLVLHDLTHGGTMDADLLAIGAVMFGLVALVVACVAISLWMMRRQDREIERAVSALEDDR